MGAHFTDADGNPAGGISQGRGYVIAWQPEPLRVDGEQREQIGADVESVLGAALDRLAFYQAGEFKCDENEAAITALRDALDALNARTADRQRRGVEGTHQL